MLRVALSRRRRTLTLAILWAVASYLWCRQFSLVLLAVDAAVLLAVRRWELKILKGRAVRLPARLAAQLVVDRQELLVESVIQGALLLISVVGLSAAALVGAIPPPNIQPGSNLIIAVGSVAFAAKFALDVYLLRLQRFARRLDHSDRMQPPSSLAETLSATPS